MLRSLLSTASWSCNTFVAINIFAHFHFVALAIVALVHFALQMMCHCEMVFSFSILTGLQLLGIFTVDLDESRDIQHMRSMILKHVQDASSEAINYMKTFSKYEYIWLEDKQFYLQRFLNDCQNKCVEENDSSDANAQIELFQAQVLRIAMSMQNGKTKVRQN